MPIDLRMEGRVLRLVLNRPEKRNALDLAMCREINAALYDANRNPRVGAVLLLGAGKAFCAGMDLAEAPHVDPTALADAHERLFTLLEWAEKPVITAVHGAALAGGTGLAANSHMLIAAESAVFGLTEIRLGLWPVLIFPAIMAAVGERRAVELAISGRTFTAAEALHYGLASELVADAQLEARATDLAAAAANLSTETIRQGLAYVEQIRHQSSAAALRTGRLMRKQLMESADFAEGVRAWNEKRKPEWPSNSVT